MKRFVVVIFILIGTLAICIYSNYTVTKTRVEITERIGSITEHLARGNRAQTLSETDSLCASWESKSHKLGHYVYHAQLDDISKSISRIQALLAFELHAEFMAELSGIQWQIEHIWESEQPVWDSIL